MRVRYRHDQPEVESERRKTPRQAPGAAATRWAIPRAPKSGQGKRLSAEKRKLREQRRRAIQARRVLAFGVLFGAIALAVWGVVALLNAPVFRVENVAVRGATHLTETRVRQIAALSPQATLLNLNKRAIEKRFAAQAWVSEVSIDRDFPHTVVISVTERRPVAIVDAGGKNMWVVSADGLWLGLRSVADTGLPAVVDLPRQTPRTGARIVSPELRNVTRILGGLSPELRAITRTVSAPTIEKTAIVTTEDVEVYFGPATDLSKKDRVALEILRKERGRVVYINVRVVDSPTWRGLEAKP